MSQTQINIATRRSPLAVFQSSQFCHTLAHVGVSASLKYVHTSGDQLQKGPLSQEFLQNLPPNAPASWATGKGLFVKEIQQALIAREAEAAVHSMKDMPILNCTPLEIVATLARAAPNDVLIFNPLITKQIRTFFHLLPNEPMTHIGFLEMFDFLKNSSEFNSTTIGTISARRQFFLKTFLSSETKLVDLRGNVDSRLKRVNQSEFGAIVLAEAGLQRLSLFEPFHMYPLDPSFFIPSATQGIVCVESQPVSSIWTACLSLQNPDSTRDALVERLLLALLDGDCSMAISCYFKNPKLLFMCAKNKRAVVSEYVFSKEDLDIVNKLCSQNDLSFSKKFSGLWKSHVSKNLFLFLQSEKMDAITELIDPDSTNR